jgi:competence protein ComEC
VAAQEPVFAHFVNVGQGDTTLFEFPGCGVMLIDTGVGKMEPTTQLMEYLAWFFEENSQYNNTIDLIINTHPHYDHTKGLRSILSQYTVRRYVDNGHTPLRAESRRVREHQNADGSSVAIVEVSDLDVIAEGYIGLTSVDIDPFNCPGMDPRIRILSGRLEEPKPDDWNLRDFQNLNNNSLVTRVDFGSASFLFTGDLETVAIDYLVEYYEDTGMLDVDVYQAGHHGARNGTTQGLIDEVTPLISVISMGVWDFHRATGAGGTAWQYGHPRKGVVRDLSSATHRRRARKTVKVAEGSGDFENFRIRKAVYGTGWDGTVVIRATTDGTYRVTTRN